MDIGQRVDELNDFKTQINLCEYAASRGFVVDRKRSGRSSAVMRHSSGDKIIVARASNRHWIYFNPHDDRDQGTIVDFVQNRGGNGRLSLGEVRKELRPWIGKISSTLPVQQEPFPALQPSQHDVTRVLAAWMKTRLIEGTHEYLERMRGIPRNVLGDPIFAGRIRIDDRRNALFPHWNSDGLCGFEIKNQGFTGFSPGGIKGLWCSRPRSDDHELVVSETAIDALSYGAIFGTKQRRFMSTAGQISPLQAELLRSATSNMPDDSTIVLAMDNDAGGKRLVTAISDALSNDGSLQWRIVSALPESEDDDWNDVLRRGNLQSAAIPTPN